MSEINNCDKREYKLSRITEKSQTLDEEEPHRLFP